MKISVYNFKTDRMETVYKSPERAFNERDRYIAIARILRRKVLKDDFLAELHKNKLSKDDIENIQSVVASRLDTLKLNDMQLKWLEEYHNTCSVSSGELYLQSELDTEQARKYFARALEAGYMRNEGKGYKWLYGGDKGQARLGYFCNKVYLPPRPINKLEETFGVKKLSSSITNADNEAKRADVKKWRNEMNNDIFND